MSLFLGIDVGTSSVRCALYDEKGRRQAVESREYTLAAQAPGQAELDVEDLWQAFCQVVKNCCAGRQVEGCGLSVFMHSLLAVDGQWQPLTQAITWADTRAAKQAETLGNHPQIRRFYRRTGCRLAHPMSPAAKLLWLRECRPEVFEKARRFVTLKEFLVHRLFGEDLVDYSDASSMGLLDMHTFQWEPEVLAAVGVEADRLGRPAPCTLVLRGMAPGAAEALGLPADTPFCLGSTDGVLANVGSGVFDGSAMTSTIGTSGALRTMLPTPYEDEELRLWSYCFAGGLWAVGGAINNGGLVLKWLRDAFWRPMGGRGEAYPLFDQWAAGVPVGCQGLTFVPALTGERSPDWNSGASGTLHGLRVSHGAPHVVRAAMEGVLFRLYSLYELLRQRGFAPPRLLASGGYANSPVWLQMQADLFGLPVDVPREKEATVLGAAYLAMCALGRIRLGERLPSMEAGQTYEPAPGQADAWQQAYGRYQTIYSRLYGNANGGEDNV